MLNNQFFKPIIVFIGDMNRFETKRNKKEITKIRPIKNTWFDWLINYISVPIRKSVGDFKDKIVNLFKTKTPKQTVWGRGKKLRKPRKQNIKKPFISEENKEKTKDRISRDILKLSETEEEKEERKESEEKEKQNERLIKDKKIRDIRVNFEQEEDYHKPKRVSSFWNNNYIECENNGDKNSNLSLDEYLKKIKPYLRNIIIYHRNSDTRTNLVNNCN